MFTINRTTTRYTSTFYKSTLAAVAAVAVLWNSGSAEAQYFRYQNQARPTANQPAANGNWAQQLFPQRDHDFGTVARAAKAEHVFEFKNDSDATIEILSVNPSCTCTLPEVPKKVIKPGETGQIIAKFQTRKFTGQRGATLNVSMKKGNQYGTALVSVKGYIRQDVVLHPQAIELPKVIAAEGADTTIKVLYAGRTDWKITEVKCANPSINVEAVETLRQNGRVEYELKTVIDQSKPGRISDVITVYTNDRNMGSFPVPVNVNVVQPIRFSETLEVNVSEGDTVIEKLLMASGTKFQIIEAECDTCPVKVNLDSQSKKVHQLELEATGQQQGRSEHVLRLKTNHPDQRYANVRLIMNVQTGK